MQIKVFYHRGFRDMIVKSDIQPLLATFTTFILRPFNLQLASLPSENEKDTRHFEFDRIMLFDFHAKDLSLS